MAMNMASETQDSGDFNWRSALNLWRAVTVETVRDDAPDLTARQTAVLMTVYLRPGPHTVRGLAAVLNVAKPAITRALDTLCTLDYVRRERDTEDRRNVHVVRTLKGAAYLEELAGRIGRCSAVEIPDEIAAPA